MKQTSSRLQEQQEGLWLKGELWHHEHTHHQNKGTRVERIQTKITRGWGD